VLRKEIVYCSQAAILICDGLCSKAWGINNRPRVQLSDDEDDYAFLADGELGEAPRDPGTYEGDQAKPAGAKGPDDMNKWCARECERCLLLRPGDPEVLEDFSVRRRNMC
jgi:hypothetical protein